MKNKQPSPHHLSNRVLPFFLLVVIVLVAAFVFFFQHNRKASSGPIKTINVASPDNVTSLKKGESTPKDVASKISSQNAESTNSQHPANYNVALTAPYGAFVSNHKPGQNGTGETEQSECITTPGATCSIKFTQNGTVRTLSAQTTDATGATFWTWDINNAGLTKGNWVVTATATIGSQSKTTTDQLKLEVQ